MPFLWYHSAMAVSFIIHYRTKPALTEGFAEALPSVARELRAVEGCEEFRVFRSEVEPDRFTLVERWASKALHDAHMERVKASGRWQQLLDQLAEPPTAGYFSELGAAD